MAKTSRRLSRMAPRGGSLRQPAIERVGKVTRVRSPQPELDLPSVVDGDGEGRPQARADHIVAYALDRDDLLAALRSPDRLPQEEQPTVREDNQTVDPVELAVAEMQHPLLGREIDRQLGDAAAEQRTGHTAEACAESASSGATCASALAGTGPTAANSVTRSRG